MIFFFFADFKLIILYDSFLFWDYLMYFKYWVFVMKKKNFYKLREKNFIGYGCKEFFWNLRFCLELLIFIEDWYFYFYKSKGDNLFFFKWIIY